jgi:hypothetical protein
MEADMCAGKDRETIDFMADKFEKGALVTHIIDPQMPKDIKFVLLRLLTHIYIDQEENRVQRLTQVYDSSMSVA